MVVLKLCAPSLTGPRSAVQASWATQCFQPYSFACRYNSSPFLTNSGLLLAGKPVNTLFVASKLQLTNEMYFAILLDRATAGPVMIGCSEGGTSIEELAEKHPDKIIKVGH